MKVIALLLVFLLAKPTLAHCPLCTAATGSAVTAARLFGLGDTTTGLLLGAFVVSGALWVHNVLKRRNNNEEYISFQAPLIIFLSFSSTILGVYFSLFDELLGWLSISDIVYGILAGSAISYATFQLHYALQKMNDGKNFIPFQGVVMTVAAMGISIAAVYLITGAT